MFSFLIDVKSVQDVEVFGPLLVTRLLENVSSKFGTLFGILHYETHMIQKVGS